MHIPSTSAALATLAFAALGPLPLVGARPVAAEVPAKTLAMELNKASPAFGGYYWEAFRFNGSVEDGAVIGLRSADFDSYLFVIDPDGRVLTNDDHSLSIDKLGPGDAGLALNPGGGGTWFAVATTYSSGQSGSFEILAEGLPPLQPTRLIEDENLESVFAARGIIDPEIARQKAVAEQLQLASFRAELKDVLRDEIVDAEQAHAGARESLAAAESKETELTAALEAVEALTSHRNLVRSLVQETLDLARANVERRADFAFGALGRADGFRAALEDLAELDRLAIHIKQIEAALLAATTPSPSDHERLRPELVEGRAAFNSLAAELAEHLQGIGIETGGIEVEKPLQFPNPAGPNGGDVSGCWGDDCVDQLEVGNNSVYRNPWGSDDGDISGCRGNRCRSTSGGADQLDVDPMAGGVIGDDNSVYRDPAGPNGGDMSGCRGDNCEFSPGGKEQLGAGNNSVFRSPWGPDDGDASGCRGDRCGSTSGRADQLDVDPTAGEIIGGDNFVYRDPAGPNGGRASGCRGDRCRSPSGGADQLDVDPTALMPELFPWPPPEASARAIISRGLFGADPPVTLGDVADILAEALAEAGYTGPGYLGVPNGFAIVTRIEQTDRSGRPLAGNARWATNIVVVKSFSISAVIRALMTAEPGFFRVMVLVVTDQPFDDNGARARLETLKTWSRKGVDALVPEVRNLPFEENYRISALVYEFEKVSESADPMVRIPGNNEVPSHLIHTRFARFVQ